MATEDKFPVLIEDDNYALELFLADHATECYATLTPYTDAPPLTAPELLKLLTDNGIIEGICTDTINELCSRNVVAQEAIENVLVAASKKARSIDGYIEFLVKPSQDRPTIEEHEDKHQVDYRDTNLFQNVQADELIALMHKPSKEDGISVTGRELIAKPGLDIYVQAGDGITKIENGHKLIATREGRVVYENQTVTVSDYLTVDFDVDFHVGHIDFVGFIRVGGDVKDGFNIHGKKGVQIDGTVGVCRVESEGSIKLGGMTGAKKPEAIIKCGGELTANYLHGVNIDCAGDIQVSYEMLHCQVNCRGALRIEGNVSGGTYQASNGISLETVGSELGIVTRLSAGIEEKEITPQGAQEEELKQITEELNRVLKQLEPLRRNPKLIAGSDRLKKLAGQLIQKYQKLNTQKEELEKEVQSEIFEKTKRLNAIRENANAKINVHRKVYHGTIIELDGYVEKIRSDISGPVSIINNTSTNALRTLPMTSLSTNARTLEQVMLKKGS